MSIAAPIPWTTRNATNAAVFGETPQQTLASVKTAKPTR